MRKLITILSLFTVLLISSLAWSETTTTALSTEGFYINDSTPSLWNDYKFGKPMLYMNWVEDFISLSMDGTFPSEWDVSDTTNGTTSYSIGLGDEIYGVLAVTAGSSLNDDVVMQLGNKTSIGSTGTINMFQPTANKTIICEARVKVTSASTTGFMFGLVNYDTSPNAHTDGIVFDKDAGDANWDFALTKSSSTSTDTAIATASDATYDKIAFVVDGVSSVKYYVDDVLEGTLTTNITTDVLRPTFYVKSGQEGSTAQTATIDYAVCVQER